MDTEKAQMVSPTSNDLTFDSDVRMIIIAYLQKAPNKSADMTA